MSRPKAKPNYGDFVLHIGTPNELKKVSTGSISTVQTAATKELKARLRNAEKFEPEAVSHIRYAMNGVNGLTPFSIKKDSPRVWEFPYMGVVFRIEVRKA